MLSQEGQFAVGILGQWASGKSTVAKMLLKALGGEEAVSFLIDVVPFARQVIDHFVSLDGRDYDTSVEADGTLRLDSGIAVLWVPPGAQVADLEPTTLRFDIIPEQLPQWLHRGRLGLARQIVETAARGRSMVIEAGYGRYPAGHGIADLFAAIESQGVVGQEIGWIIVEAAFARRGERNRRRPHGPSPEVFARYAEDGGGLEPAQEEALASQGYRIQRVANEHDDLERLRAQATAAFEALCPWSRQG